MKRRDSTGATRIHWRDVKNGNRLDFVAVAIASRLGAFRFWIADQIENSNRPLLRDFRRKIESDSVCLVSQFL